jgi:hypothetical protein
LARATPKLEDFMSPHQTIAVAVRLFAIWLFVSVVVGFLTFYAKGGPLASGTLPFVGTAVGLTGLVVLVLWFFPQTIARRLLSASDRTPARSEPADTWLAMGCALVGLFVLSSALPATLRDLLILFISRNDNTITDTSVVKQGLLYDSLRVGIAVWLILGAAGVRKVFWWARYAGIGADSTNH